MVCEAHQKALAAVATQEEENEWLNHTQAHSQSRARSKSRNHRRPSREGWRKRHHQVQFEDQSVPSCTANPKTESSEQGSNGEGSYLEELPELKPMVASFLRGSPKLLKMKMRRHLQSPQLWSLVGGSHGKAERCETPEWWPKLSTVPGRDDSRRLAREVQASFGLPWRMQELGSRKATLQAPPAPPSLCRPKFMLQTKSIYAMQGHKGSPQGKSGGICHSPPAFGRAK